MLARLGTVLVGGAVLPMLPVDRSGRLKMVYHCSSQVVIGKA